RLARLRVVRVVHVDVVLGLAVVLAGGLPAGRRVDPDGLAPVDVVVRLAGRRTLLPVALTSFLGFVLRLALQFLCPFVRAESPHSPPPDCRVARPDAARAWPSSLRAGALRSSTPPIAT